MTESESVALPLGDSPIRFTFNILSISSANVKRLREKLLNFAMKNFFADIFSLPLIFYEKNIIILSNGKPFETRLNRF